MHGGGGTAMCTVESSLGATCVGESVTWGGGGIYCHVYKFQHNSIAGVPVQQVSPRRVSGKAVPPAHAPDILYGPQGQ